MDLDALMDALDIDREATISRFAGNAQLYARFLCKFPQDTTYPAICAARADGDADAYLRAVHTLKGVSGNLGLTRLFQLCTELLTALRGGQTLAQTQALDEQLTAAYQHVTETLEQANLSA